METKSAVTFEEYEAMDLDWSRRPELIDGQIRYRFGDSEVSGTGWRHGILCTQLAIQLGCDQTRCAVTANAAFRLKPKRVRIPDIALVRRDRAPHGDYEKTAEISPDLVAEIISPNDKHSDVQRKTHQWLDADVRVVVLVDPVARSVTVHRGRTDVSIHFDGTVAFDDIADGLTLDVAALFDTP